MQDIQAEAKRMWQSKETREEFFNDIDNLIAFLENQHKVKEHKGGISSHKKPETLDDDATGDDASLKTTWNASKSLQDEFMGDFQAYAAYERNRHKAKVYNR